MKSSTLIRVSKEAHNKLRLASYEQNKRITDIIDEMLKVKHEMTMVERLLKEKK